MRTLGFIFLCIILTGCSSQKNLDIKHPKNYDSKGIVYIFPTEVYKLLNNKINEMLKEENINIYILLDKKDSQIYRVYLGEYTESTTYANWIQNTNRYVFVKKTLYPLIFMTDHTFAIKESSDEFLSNITESGEYSYTNIHSFRHQSYVIEFNIKGEILYEGYDSIIKEK